MHCELNLLSKRSRIHHRRPARQRPNQHASGTGQWLLQDFHGELSRRPAQRI